MVAADAIHAAADVIHARLPVAQVAANIKEERIKNNMLPKLSQSLADMTRDPSKAAQCPKAASQVHLMVRLVTVIQSLILARLLFVEINRLLTPTSPSGL